MRLPAAALAVAVTLAALPTAGCGDSGESEVALRAVASAVDLRITGCRVEPVRGAGSMIAGNVPSAAGASAGRYILTAAHVVAGATTIVARSAFGGGDTPAVLVAIDPMNDLALLASDISVPALPIGGLASGDAGVVVLFNDHAAAVQPFRIVNQVIVNILDIYDENKISRPGYRVAIDIDPGDSGAVLVGPDNAAGGVLYAKSQGTVGNAFATDMSSVGALMSAAEAADPETGIDTGACP